MRGDLAGSAASGGVPTSAASSSSFGNSAVRGDRADDRGLEQVLGGLEGEVLRVEDVLEARRRVELLEVRLDRLRRRLEADLAGGGDEAGDEAGAQRPARARARRAGRPSRTACRCPSGRRPRGAASGRRPGTIASFICSIAFGPAAESASRPASRIAAPLTSMDFATWPFLRASSFFLGVAFSVLSSAMALADLQRVQRLRDRDLQLVGDEAGDERQRGAQQRRGR